MGDAGAKQGCRGDAGGQRDGWSPAQHGGAKKVVQSKLIAGDRHSTTAWQGGGWEGWWQGELQ